MSPLVLLHGFTGGPGTFDAVLAALPPGRRVLRPLLAGHGGAPFPDAVATFEDEIGRLAGLIRDWSPEPVHLVGYSLGARVALTLLLAHPGLVARGTLVGGHPGLPTEAARAGRRGQDTVWARLLEQGDLESFVAMWERQPLFATHASLPTAQIEAQRHERLSHDPRGLAAALRVLGLGAMPDQTPRLPACPTPLELVVGEHDAAFRAHAERIALACPRARTIVVPDAGHNVARERPLALAQILSEEIAP